MAFQRDARELIDLDRRRRPARPGYRGDHFARYNLEWDIEGTVAVTGLDETREAA